VAPARTIVDLIESGTTDAHALVVPDGSAAYSYGQLADAVASVAAALHDAEVRHGDRVALAAADSLQFLLLLFGALAAGATVAPLNPAYTEHEFAISLRDIAPRCLLLPGGNLRPARAAAKAAEIALVDIAAEEPRAGRTLGVSRGSVNAAGPDDIALLLHTSGTTSTPKQVPLLHRNLVASARTIAAFYDLDRHDVAYCAMPLFHVHGLVATVLATLTSGGTVVVPRRFTPRGLLDHLEPHGVTWFSASPTIHTMIAERNAKARRQTPTAHQLRFLRSCSSTLPERLRSHVEESFHVPLLEAYGMTEASHQISSNPLPPQRRLGGSVGIPTGTEVAVLDNSDTFLPCDRTGEIVLRGPNVMPGYLDDPSANTAAFFEGWFRTGDLGAIDRLGYLRLEGRIKDMVNRGGENISPYEVEEVLTTHPGVREAACFAIPDRKYGEEVVAAVVLAEDVTTDELLAHCRERLAAYKAPKRLYVVDRIPRTPTGKLQRRRLPSLLGIGADPGSP